MNKIPQNQKDSVTHSAAYQNLDSTSAMQSLAPPPLQFKTKPTNKSDEEKQEVQLKEKSYAGGAAENPEDNSDDGSSNKKPFQLKAASNNTGLPDNLKSGIEGLSGFSMDDVQVNYNSSKPAQLQAHAYAQGSKIEIGPGQEKHLPHEAWHVVQQKQGRVQPTTQLKAFNINDDIGLEKEADVMGEKAMQLSKADKKESSELNGSTPDSQGIQLMKSKFTPSSSTIIQRLVDLDTKYSAEQFAFEDKDIWIQKFKQVQDILNNQGIVDNHLQTLSDLMVQQNLSLSEVLKQYEGRTFSKKDTLLTDFVPPDVFLSLLREGRLFEDLVGKTHGVQTHRIQWSVVKSVLGCAETESIFKETGNPRWQLPNGRTIWDNIVDGINTDARDDQDFTIPDKLEAYIYGKYEQYKFFNKRRNDSLTYDLHETHDAVDSRKSKIKERYPEPADFPPEWETIKETHLEQKRALSYRLYSEYITENSHLYKNHTIVKTTTVDDETKTIEWTGWILNESSQQPIPDGPFFVPTVGTVLNDGDE